MTKQKRVGRPPAFWVRQLSEADFDKTWIDPYEIAKRFDLNVRTVKSFIQKLPVKAEHEVVNGKAKARFKAKDLTKAAKEYVEKWL
jgi:hypothetical protein